MLKRFLKLINHFNGQITIFDEKWKKLIQHKLTSWIVPYNTNFKTHKYWEKIGMLIN